jgi:hypothetical protein
MAAGRKATGPAYNMIRLSTLFWLVAISTAGFAMFAVKYEVQSLADQLARTVNQANDTERDIRVLNAEWAYLNRPDALAKLNNQILSLVPIATTQLRASVAEIPMRPPPPPPVLVPSATLVAESPPVLAPTPSKDILPVAAEVPSGQAVEVGPQREHELEQSRTAVNSSPTRSSAPDPHVGAQSAGPAPIKMAARRHARHQAASLDQLIAQIAESR